jgi:hypothetical protein
MPISVLDERVEEEQAAILACFEARSREELAKALLEIALQRSRASAGAALLDEYCHQDRRRYFAGIRHVS